MLKRRIDGNPWDTVQQINKAWVSGEVEDIDELFHPNAVIVHPGFEGRTEGRADCVQSYMEFTMQAVVSRLDAFDEQVDVVDDTAVVSYGFEIDYEMEGRAYSDSGTDLFVLSRGPAGWQVVWRTLLMDES
jgi:ketosteroid isomerase-like protein